MNNEKNPTSAETAAACILPFCFSKHTASRNELQTAFTKTIQDAINIEVREAKKTHIPENVHIITAKYLPYTERKGNRISIYSARFKQRVIVSKEKFDTGEEWCRANGFNVLGTGFTEDHLIIVSDTFQPLKKTL